MVEIPNIEGLVIHSTCKIISNDFFVFRSSEIMFSFLIKKSRLKAIEIETALFHSLENRKDRAFDCFFYV